jgi:hypothetical protein
MEATAAVRKAGKPSHTRAKRAHPLPEHSAKHRALRSRQMYPRLHCNIVTGCKIDLIPRWRLLRKQESWKPHQVARVIQFPEHSAAKHRACGATDVAAADILTPTSVQDTLTRWRLLFSRGKLGKPSHTRVKRARPIIRAQPSIELEEPEVAAADIQQTPTGERTLIIRWRLRGKLGSPRIPR